MRRHVSHQAAAAAMLIVTFIAFSCGKAPGGGESTARQSLEQGFAVGLLLPESKTARYEAFDRPLIERNLKAGCPHCTLLYLNAQQDASKQLAQADSLLSRGVQVLILDPVDAKAAGAIVTKAEEQGVPVVAYDRFAAGPIDAFVTFDNVKVGEEQGRALLSFLARDGDPKRGPLVMVNGSPTDPNAAEFKRGAHAVLDGKVDVGYEVDTPDWSPDKAQQEVEQALTKLGAAAVVGVYAANDGLASGAIAALKGHGVTPLPPVTGQDAELAAIQRILAGDQAMTIYKPYPAEAEAAARMALAVAQGKQVEGTVPRTNSSGHQVPSLLLPVVSVTRDNVATTVVADGVYTAAEICTPAFEAACRRAGLAPER
ncbi:MAG TPA: substrate-binding domain-containing protein [Thermoanaerobaculia bacterium]|nr:substrate-binding domain-containing protein [Thermoanaerobaculia bacterium]